MSGVIVGVDQSDTARRAAECAADIANKMGEPLHLVMAMKRGRTHVTRSGTDVFVHDWVTDGRSFLTALAGELNVCDVTVAIGVDDPAQSLCEEAERLDATMIVVGNRRTRGASRVLGSIASDVLRSAPCAVHVAPTDIDDGVATAGGAGTAEASLRMTSAKLFDRCTPKERRRIEEISTPVAMEAGRVLASEGERGREFGVLLTGSATVTIDGEVVATLSAGDHFGEMALLDRAGLCNGQRSATVTADVDLWASVMSVAEFGSLLAEFPDVERRLRTEAAERAAAN